LLAVAAGAHAGDPPTPLPPCGGEPFPAYPTPGAPPAVQVWDRADWTPPPCTGWQPSASSTIVATAGRFRGAGGVDGLRGRIGAVSRMKGLLYWSTSNQQWQPFIVDAAALDGPTGARRKDFTIDETAPGRVLYLEQEDNLFGKETIRLRIIEATATRLVFATENSAILRMLGLPLAQPGEIQSICFLDRESGDVWRYYSLARTGKAASLLTAGHDASIINRAVASFRYLAGIRPDLEPPARR
jgi:hypothetical protein